ncbi:MAG TPA: GlsB/YeaQ/YmgE family stress response membrane protein [Ktedonobacteraceae bacterium]|jgi:uncharacterized membrane protein YeaQ/YmgE (transglycosylase-associated protein family)|nr:GlsB/YeaQ/YmgE family stress response membrane protein [Ktedonobacteraceae bacterium]
MFLASIPGITFNLDLLSWIIVGAIAGFFASRFVRGKGYGCLGNTVVGMIGAIIGGYLASFLSIQGNFHFWGSLFISFIGACILVAVLQLFTGGFDRS